LKAASLQNAFLNRADVTDGDLTGSILDFADLSNSSLRRANLSRASFRNAVLSGADLSFADVRGANFSRADLRSADLTGASGLAEVATWREANVKGLKGVSKGQLARIFREGAIRH
jgi:uncharacterized protein YjbI with pentapeptide repeats